MLVSAAITVPFKVALVPPMAAAASVPTAA